MTATYEEFDALRRVHPAWRLLRADSAPLVLSFLGRVFVDENVRSISAADLTARLNDVLVDVNTRLGDGTFPRPAREYLDTWASPDNGWLRKYYPIGETEAFFDATPDVERAIGWLRSLRAADFVGTRSRLNTVVELLRQMAVETQTDPDVRLAALERRQAEIDAEIARIRGGDVRVLDRSELRDHYQQFATTARALLSDFRQVEANFRALDRELREQIAGWDGSKGGLLESVVGSRRSIQESDQGRSFHAFYDFLLSAERQAEFADLLSRVQSLPGLDDADRRLDRIHHDWLDACERTQGTVRLLSDQLRRFLDDRVWLENRRVSELLRRVEGAALRLRDGGGPWPSTQIDGARPEVALPMERPMYTPPTRAAIDSSAVEPADVGDVDTGALFDILHVDTQRLAGGVRRALQRQSQIDLPDILARQPLELGLAELVAYLGLEDPAFDVVFDGDRAQVVRWTDDTGTGREARLPAVTFVLRTPAVSA